MADKALEQCVARLPLEFLDMPLTLVQYDGEHAVLLDGEGRLYRMVGSVCRELGITPGKTFDFGMYKHRMWWNILQKKLSEPKSLPWWMFWKFW